MKLDPLPVLEGRGTTLRRAQSNDVEGRLRLGNDPDILEMFGVSRDAVRPPLRTARRGGSRTSWIIPEHG
jgi:hypothetical protein